MTQLPAITRKGFMFVLSSPSGAGKTTLSRLLLEQDTNLKMSISATTRAMRPNEVHGVDYYFVPKNQFGEMVGRGEFLECAEVFGNHYGTPETMVKQTLETGKDVLFDIDWQGTEQLAERCPADLVSVFILPPSMQELEVRLRKRAQDSEEVIQSRMEKAADEISHWNIYDYVLVNHNLEECLQDIYAILCAERKKRERQHGLPEYVKALLA